MADHINLLSSLEFFFRARFNSHMCSPISFSPVSLLLLMVYSRTKVNTDIENSSTSGCFSSLLDVHLLISFAFPSFIFVICIRLNNNKKKKKKKKKKKRYNSYILIVFCFVRSFGRFLPCFCLQPNNR